MGSDPLSPGLFAEDTVLARFPMPDADVQFLRWLPLGAPPDAILARLIVETPWRAEKVVMWGKEYAQPRLIAWYGDERASYTYSATRFDPLPWTPLLSDLRARVEAAVEARFNSVLVNYYRGERDSVAMHSDDERELGPEPVIAALSLGETRTFVLRHKHDKTQKTRRLALESGSLLLMQGATQRCWHHGVPKEKQRRGPRISLTFRQILMGSR